MKIDFCNAQNWCHLDHYVRRALHFIKSYDFGPTMYKIIPTPLYRGSYLLN